MLTGKLDVAPGTDVAEDLKDRNVPADVFRVVKACAASDANRRPKDGAALVDLLAKLGQPTAMPVLLTPVKPTPTIRAKPPEPKPVREREP